MIGKGGGGDGKGRAAGGKDKGGGRGRGRKGNTGRRSGLQNHDHLNFGKSIQRHLGRG